MKRMIHRNDLLLTFIAVAVGFRLVLGGGGSLQALIFALALTAILVLAEMRWRCSNDYAELKWRRNQDGK